ncbi:YehR family protein [Oceanobacillus jeddahense]|uniref:YehR family protein n=1 Tax=Oceanobacillus jeddahense TaxID=1462527 RepID=A0ABY5JUG0_9BACI|nr:DUF1307 domain-containing protein [Oceanobacillus jeddahense]UUI03794.1 YehR family protein [Oceanobacillus jeddahense]
MKKKTFRITGLLFLLIAILGLVACGSNETVTLQGEEMGQQQEITLEAQNDEVQSMAAELTLPYELMGIESQEEAESMDELLQAEFEEANEADGVEVELSYEEEEIVVAINIDLTTAGPEELNTLGFGIDQDSFEDEDLSLESMVSELEDNGLEVVDE